MATLGEQAVGSIIKLNVDGVATNFIVVHKGLPGTMYDSSCDGTWLLMEDVYTLMDWGGSSIKQNYANSSIHSYLNDTFINLLDSDVKDTVKQVKIPYYKVSGTSSTAASGANGLSAKAFLLSFTEVGFSSKGYAPVLGAVIKYFKGASDSKRVALLDGSTSKWWLRTPDDDTSSGALVVDRDGTCERAINTTYSRGIRPALVLPPETAVSPEGMIGGSKAITGTVPINGVQRELTGKGYINIGGVLRDLSDSQVNIVGALNSLKG